jgi:hypothetical protein
MQLQRQRPARTRIPQLRHSASVHAGPAWKGDYLIALYHAQYLLKRHPLHTRKAHPGLLIACGVMPVLAISLPDIITFAQFCCDNMNAFFVSSETFPIFVF